MQGVFNKTNEVYFLSWAWDLSGASPFLHPAEGTAKEEAIIPLVAGELREFIGAGVVLFPARRVKSGIAVRIQLWESDAGARAFGKTLGDLAKTIQESKLTNLLALLALATGATTTAATATTRRATHTAPAFVPDD